MFDWGDLRHFLAVAETGSLSAAARELGQSQPTVGRRLDALEQRLGAALFVRTGTGMALTDFGRTTLDYARQIRDQASGIARAAANQEGGLRGTVRISTVEGIAAEWLTPQMGVFRQRYPDIEIELIADNSVADLVNRDADIAVRLFRPVQNTLITRRLATIHYGFYAHRDLLAAQGQPRTLADLANFDFVGWDDTPSSQGKLESFRENAQIATRPVFRSNSPSAMVAAVAAGIGIGRLPIAMADSNPLLARLFPDVVAAELDIWLVSHPELRSSARIRALWDFIIEQTELFRQSRTGFV